MIAVLALLLTLLVAAPAAAQSCQFSVTGCLSIQGLIGPSGEIEQLILKSTATTPNSMVGHARIMYSGGQLLLSTEGGAYAPIGSGGGGGGVTSLNALTGILSITGAANRITVSTPGGGAVNVTTPQDIHTAATPTFAGATLSGLAGVGARCVQVDAAGVVSATGGACGIGGGLTGSGVATHIPFFDGATNLTSDAGLVWNNTTKRLILANIAAGASTACLQIDTSGVITNTGASCGAGGAGVTSLDGLTGGLTFVDDTNVTITGAGSQLTVGWVGTTAPARGGTGLNTSAVTGVPSILSGTWSVAATLSSGLGGTGLNTAGSTGIPSLSAGTWTVTSAAPGAVVFGSAASGVAVDAANFFFDDTNNRLGIGTSSPTHRLTVTRAAGAPTVLFDSTTTLASDYMAPLAVRAVTTAQMVDGFGPGIEFHVKDADAEKHIGLITTRRSTGDTTAQMEFWTKIGDALAPRAYIDPLGQFAIINQSSGSGAQLYIDGSNSLYGVNIRMIGTGGTPVKTLRAFDGSFEVINHFYSAVLMQVKDAGDTFVSGTLRPGIFPAASFPANSAAGRLAYQTDSVRGLHMDTGVQWLPIGAVRVMNVRLYGALGNDSTNDTAAIQAAADAVCAPSTTDKGGVLYFPAGWYRINAAININCGMVIHGDGWGDLESAGGSKIVLTSTTQDGLVLNSPNNVVIRDLSITALGTQTDGAMIRFTGTSSGTSCFTRNPGTRITNVLLHAAWIGVMGSATCGGAEVSSSFISAFRSRGVSLLGAGGGGFIVRGNFMYCVVANCIASDAVGDLFDNYLHASGSGSTVILFAPTAFAESPRIANNIIEGDVNTTVGLSLVPNNVLAINVVITGNHFYGMQNGIQVAGTGVSGAVERLTITGNTFGINDGGARTCIDLDDVMGASIVGNTCGMGAGTTTGIVLRASTSYISIGENAFDAEVDTKISNSSASPTTISYAGGRANIVGTNDAFADWRTNGVTRFAVAGTGATTIFDDSGAIFQLAVGGTGANGANIVLGGNGATTPSKFLRANNGNFEIVDSTYTNILLRVTESIADGSTSLLLRRNVGGSLTLQAVTMGAADSGGAGFKLLRVPN